jgi:glycosyltransferase involved in cell wall biosynthesis
MLLSIIIPNYNHGKYLEKRIKSILSQIGEDSEIILVDDASTDNSLEVIAQIHDKRVKLLKNSVNLGVVKSANLAIQAAKGKYIVPFGADDQILDGFIEKSLKVLIEHPEIPLCCSDPGTFHTDFPEKIHIRPLLPGVKDPCIFKADDFVQICKKTNFYLPGHTIVIKKEALLQFGGYDEKLGSGCDWFLHHSIALKYGAAYLPYTLSLWRSSNNNYSISDRKKRKVIYRRMLEILMQKTNLTLRSQFKKSTLLRVAVFTLFWEILLQPRNWDILATTLTYIPTFALRRWKKCSLKS